MRQAFWSTCPVIPLSLAPPSTTSEPIFAELVDITTDLDLTPTSIPVRPENRKEWTERQRAIAGSAAQAISITDLKDKVRRFNFTCSGLYAKQISVEMSVLQW